MDKYNLVIHEETYKRGDIASQFHQNRLRNVLRLFEEIDIQKTGKLGDFGCSNGYFFEELQASVLKGKNWKFTGFDYEDELLKIANQKSIKNAKFHFFDLNIESAEYDNQFDIVTCFETIEHVGNHINAIKNLYRACKPGGHIIITIPNEKGIPGIIKYLGRRILRKNAYEDFFDNQSELKYFGYLLLNKKINVFRDPSVEGWGPHLGFDAQLFDQDMNKILLDTNQCELLIKSRLSMGFNFLYVLKKNCMKITNKLSLT